MGSMLFGSPVKSITRSCSYRRAGIASKHPPWCRSLSSSSAEITNRSPERQRPSHRNNYHRRRILAGVFGSDDVVLNGTAAGSFNNKNVGVAKPVSVSDLSISGTDSGNYAFVPPTLSADITAAGFTVIGLSARSRALDALGWVRYCCFAANRPGIFFNFQLTECGLGSEP